MNGQERRRSGRVPTVAAALGVLAAIAAGLWGVPLASSAVDGCTDQEVKVGIVQAKGCWSVKGTTYSTTQPVDLNGFTVTPKSGATFSIDSDSRLATTNGKPVGLAAKPLSYQDTPLNFRIPNADTVEIANTTLPPGLVVAGFNLVANVQTKTILKEGGGSIDLPLQFFNFLTVIGKSQTVTTHTEVVPGEGAKYDGLDIDLSGLTLKAVPIGIEEFHAEYSLSQNSWGGSASIVFPKGDEEAGIKGGFNIANGKLTNWQFGLTGINAEIAPAVFLQHLQGGMGFDPFSANFGAGVTAGPTLKILGHEVSAAAVDGTLTIQGNNGPAPGFVGLSGNASVINIPVASGSLHAYFNGVVDLNASLGLGFPSFTNDSRQPFYVGASASGWIGDGRFNLAGRGQLKLFDRQVAGSSVVFSDRGIGACAGVWVFIVGDISIGFGYSFRNQTVTPYFAGCDLGPYQDWNKPTRRIADRQADRATGSLGQRHNVLRVSGDDDVPGFTLTSDDGTTIEHDAADDDGEVNAEDHAVIPNDAADEAIVVLSDPEGDWTIEEAPGSEITQIQRARQLREERVDAEVRGRGRQRTLVWDARDFPRQKLQFHERLSDGVVDPILLTNEASGRHRFKVRHGGFYGNRALEVQVLQQGTPRADHVLDNYKVTKPAKPPRPRGLAVHRDGDDITARWNRSPGARSYAVVLESADGDLRFTKVRGKGSRRARFKDSPLAKHMVVKVFALNRDDGHGRPAKRRFDRG